MARVRMCVTLLVVTLLSSYVSGSHISLTASSPSIHPHLSPSLNLRCALEHTASSATIIGRSVSSTPNDAKFVISMIVFQNGVDIATISEHIPAKALYSTSKLEVTGEIPGVQDEQGFIAISFKYPDESQGGNYSCQVTAIDEVGHQVIYSTSVNVDVMAPTIDDLVRHAHAQDLRADREINAMNIRLDQEVNNNNALKTRVSQLQAELNESKHIEHGVIMCGALGYTHPLTNTKDVTFQTRYNSSPIVYIAVLDMDTHKDLHAYLEVKLVNVDDAGFSVTCSVPDSGHYVGDLKMSWLSLP